MCMATEIRNIWAGAATADITDHGAASAGWVDVDQKRASTGLSLAVDNPLFVKALLFKEGEVITGFVTLDVVALDHIGHL